MKGFLGMFRNNLKKIVAKFPEAWQQNFKRHYYSWRIFSGSFGADEPEYTWVEAIIRPDDWVIDIGANVGHYALKFSKLVGKNGRVIALEPVPRTFHLLTANMENSSFQNVTLLNVAASDKNTVRYVNVPTSQTGMHNYYRASIIKNDSSLNVFCIKIDSLLLSNKIALVKIDVEGHELAVLSGMNELLKRDHPYLIVEASSETIINYLKSYGYINENIPGSPNYVFTYPWK